MALDVLFSAVPSEPVPNEPVPGEAVPNEPAAIRLDRATLRSLRDGLTRLHEYVIRLRCEEPAKGTRAQAHAYLHSQTSKLAAASVEAGGTENGWPDPADVFANADQIAALREALAELTAPEAPYPVPLPPGCWLLPTANFDVFAWGRLYNGKLSAAGQTQVGAAGQTQEGAAR